MKLLARPKSNYEPAITVKETIEYMKKKAPFFVDLDEFLLFFTVHPYAYYPVEERLCLGEDSDINQIDHRNIFKARKNDHSLSRVKSTQ